MSSVKSQVLDKTTTTTSACFRSRIATEPNEEIHFRDDDVTKGMMIPRRRSVVSAKAQTHSSNENFPLPFLSSTLLQPFERSPRSKGTISVIGFDKNKKFQLHYRSLILSQN
ncbi:hypothetical protein M0802_011412 [Mischocyttarus mexicanus]|nr:hypothetical protein M0802_011412 [Mischocyttarus mexicanus]